MRIFLVTLVVCLYTFVVAVLVVIAWLLGVTYLHRLGAP